MEGLPREVVCSVCGDSKGEVKRRPGHEEQQGRCPKWERTRSEEEKGQGENVVREVSEVSSTCSMQDPAGRVRVLLGGPKSLCSLFCEIKDTCFILTRNYWFGYFEYVGYLPHGITLTVLS